MIVSSANFTWVALNDTSSSSPTLNPENRLACTEAFTIAFNTSVAISESNDVVPYMAGTEGQGPVACICLCLGANVSHSLVPCIIK
ncbi:hypothetical protein TSUD_188370 [Trifolium subterraneum]|uniref:Uncharacterized protein n=1 Tax=Trifolium subterraneum TaxID=3900 RepID=A0A2Z6PG05_TRISU|nr:hypothetical protein TSUD_188370 [Trifolium subterraneum]